ncbi:hemolysin D [Prochlorococcus marinus XMU1403]|nr:hemolysin D [Prochlorococcus marinus str. MU1403]PYE00566.1 hemolysin D [Prochlorococcus marinus XMU1403]
MKNNANFEKIFNTKKPKLFFNYLKNNYELNKVKIINYSSKLKPILILQNLQDLVEKLALKNTNQVFLRQSRFWAISITWVLMGGTAFFVGWIAIAETDEVVMAMGKLEPKSGVVPVQLPIDGVANEILVKEGEIVKKDQLLIRLDTEITQARHAAIKKKLEINKKILDKLETLVNEGAVSELQFLQQQTAVEDVKSELKTSSVTLKYQEILSPVDGIVFELRPKGAGYVSRGSEAVMKIVPFDNLIAKIEIDSRTIGFVKTGKSVEISLDSFPASDFGALQGKVTRISSDALPPNPAEGKGYRFPADITLDTQYLKLKTGKKLSLQAGMGLTANIKLRKVTYLKLFLNKFSDKADSLKAI